jgi:hypothetical protein
MTGFDLNPRGLAVGYSQQNDGGCPASIPDFQRIPARADATYQDPRGCDHFHMRVISRREKMSPRFRPYISFVSAACAVALVPAIAHANVSGFGNFSQFTINQNDAGAQPTFLAPETIELINGANEARSIFANTAQNISQFTASFTYQVFNPGQSEGAAFVLENDPRGASAVGTGNHALSGIQNMVNVTFNIGDNNSGQFTTNNGGGSGTNVSPVVLASGDPINIQFAYSGSTLTESLFDTVTSASFTTTYQVPIPTDVGGGAAFVGLTAGSSTNVDQLFSNFQFTSAPEPASLSLLGVATLPLFLRRRRHD